MSREIKFRIFLQHGETGRTAVDYQTLDELLSRNGCYWSPRWAIISKDQLADIKDENKKDIYENDIVEFLDLRGVHTKIQSCDDGMVKIRAVVVWKNGGFVLDKENPFNENIKKRKSTEQYDRDLPYIYSWGGFPRGMVVIGNTHEHGDLIK